MKFKDLFSAHPYNYLSQGSNAKDYLFGTPNQLKENPNYNPQQQSFLDMLIKNLQGPTQGSFDWLNSLYGDEGFADYERPAMEQFNQQIVPGIIEKFAGAGAKSSSGLNQTLAQAGRGLSGDLAAQRGNLRMQGTQALQNYGNQALNRPSTPYIQQGQEGNIGKILAMLARAGAGGI